MRVYEGANRLVEGHAWWTRAAELGNVTLEAESNDGRTFALEHLAEDRIKLWTVFEIEKIDQESICIARKLKNGDSVRLVPFVDDWPPFRVDSDVLLSVE